MLICEIKRIFHIEFAKSLIIEYNEEFEYKCTTVNEKTRNIQIRHQEKEIYIYV